MTVSRWRARSASRCSALIVVGGRTRSSQPTPGSMRRASRSSFDEFCRRAPCRRSAPSIGRSCSAACCTRHRRRLLDLPRRQAELDRLEDGIDAEVLRRRRRRPELAPLVGAEGRDFHDHAGGVRPARVPARRAVQDGERGAVGERPEVVHAAGVLGQLVDRTGDQHAAAEQRLPVGGHRHLGDALRAAEAGEVDAHRRPSLPAASGAGQLGGAARRRRPQVQHVHALADGRRDHAGVLGLDGVDGGEHVDEGLVGGVAAEQVGDHAVGYPQDAAQQRPALVVHLDETAPHQPGTGPQPVPGRRGPRRQPGHPQRQAHGRPAARHVVVEEAVERLEALVDVGRGGDEQQLLVDRVEHRLGPERHQPRRQLLRLGVALGGGAAGVRFGDLLVAAAGGEQRVDLVVREVEAEERVVEGRVGGPAPVDDGLDPDGERVEAAQEVPDRDPRNVTHRRAAAVTAAGCCAARRRGVEAGPGRRGAAGAGGRSRAPAGAGCPVPACCRRPPVHRSSGRRT